MSVEELAELALKDGAILNEIIDNPELFAKFRRRRALALKLLKAADNHSGKDYTLKEVRELLDRYYFDDKTETIK